MIIKTRNTLADESPKTFLSQSLASGGTTSSVRNINDFNDNWAIQIGATGHEKTEIAVVNGNPASGEIDHDAVDYNHPTDTPVYSIKYDKVIFKRSTDGTAGTASAITNGTVDYAADSEFTQFDDTSGSTSYAYKASFYSSALATESPDSDWLTSQGFPWYSLGKMRQRVKDKSVANVDDFILDDWINEWYGEMRNTAINVNEDYFLGTTDVSFSGTTQLGTITDTNYVNPRRVWLTVDGSNWYRATKKEINDIDPNDEYYDTVPYFFIQSDNVIGRLPHDSNGTARIVFYSLGTTLTDDTDELPASMRGYTKSFVDYALSQAAYKDNRPQEALVLEQKAGTAREDFKNKITPMDRSGNKELDIVEIW